MGAFPEPQPGLVVCYAFLWHEEEQRGLVEGRKDRPCVVMAVLDSLEERHARWVTVAPITHAPPRDLHVAVEMPARIKSHLGLDEARSWIMLDEVNVFEWPGVDLRPARRGADSVDHGFLPPRFFTGLMEQWARVVAEQLVASVVRSDL